MDTIIDISDFNMEGNNEKNTIVAPEQWTIITALDYVLEQARGSKLSNEFLQTCNSPLEFLRSALGLTDIQIVILAILVEAGEPQSWHQLGEFVGCSRLSMMVYTDDIENLLEKRWLVKRGAHEHRGWYEGYALEHGVVTALRHNTTFVPEKLDGLDEQQFMDKLEHHVDRDIENHVNFSETEGWMLQLVKANSTLPLCRQVLTLNDIHEQSLLLMVAFDYAQWAGSEDEGLWLATIDKYYPSDFECNFMRRQLEKGNHCLIRCGYIEYKNEDGIANTRRYVLTRKAKEDLLAAYEPSKSKVPVAEISSRFMKSHTSIKAKELFFNAVDQQQVDRLVDLLSVDHLPEIQQRLEQEGMRTGFACLFYGAPGTGKTETVLQLARLTGRDIVQVDIAGLRDKYVGESEKNIKAVFAHYRALCKNSDVTPILFFNEADGIINKRIDNITHSVDKMDNAMQNIILQEIENLGGILIATTNLTSNLDSAFERRFLFKIEFHKPEPDVKAKIWMSMVKGMSENDAHRLATKFDFSGGQIENIARKRTIDYILTGRQATLEELEDFCRVEFLNSKDQFRPVLGFTAR